MGFAGVTGHSQKMLSNLSHFGLIEKSGKGGIRVTELAAKILASHSQGERIGALREAAFTPDLFAEIRDQWKDGYVSTNGLQSFLERGGFADAAIQPAIKSYQSTYDFLQQEGGTESHSAEPSTDAESVPKIDGGGLNRVPLPGPSANASIQSRATATQSTLRQREGAALMNEERELTTGLLSKEASFRLIVTGPIGERELDRLIKKLQLDKEILADKDNEGHSDEKG
jgi:hypothetical protein